MDSNPEEKKSKKECIDRISELPDSILGEILSYLPTKIAVGTSILSTRWKYIFPFGLPPIKLDLDDSLFLHPEGNEPESPSKSFMEFVDKLLNETLHDVSCVDEFTLKCEKHYGDAKFISWICAAVRLNVRELRLKCFLSEPLTLFHTLNGCITLTRLELRGKFKLYIPANFSLPTLKTLDLFNVILYDDNDYELTMALINGCPSLEELSLIDCDLKGVEFIRIKSTLLKSLIIQNSWGPSCHLELDTPNLERLLWNDCVAHEFSISPFNSLRWAHIDVGPSKQQSDDFYMEYGYMEDFDEEIPWHFDEVGGLVYDCRDTRHLYLATRTIECLHRRQLFPPSFQNLTCLALACIMGSHGWAVLARLLCSAPCLKKLTLEGGFKDYEDGYSNFKSAVSSSPFLCLEFNLKDIEIWVFNEQEDEIKLIEYFLKNGNVLQTLKLRCRPFDDKNVLHRLRMLPGQSKIRCYKK